MTTLQLQAVPSLGHAQEGWQRPSVSRVPHLVVADLDRFLAVGESTALDLSGAPSQQPAAEPASLLSCQYSPQPRVRTCSRRAGSATGMWHRERTVMELLNCLQHLLTHSSSKSRERTSGDKKRRWQVESRRPSSACWQKQRFLPLIPLREGLENAAWGETEQRRHYRADLTSSQELFLSKVGVWALQVCTWRKVREIWTLEGDVAWEDRSREGENKAWSAGRGGKESKGRSHCALAPKQNP